MAAQAEECQHVREHHHGVDQIGAFPDEPHGNDCPEIDHQDIAKFIERNTFLSQKVFRCFFTEIGPSDQGSDGEGGQRDRQKGVAHIRQMSKGGCSQSDRKSVV